MDVLERFAQMLGSITDRLIRRGRSRTDRDAPSITEDEHRLDRAFAKLDHDGIMARQCLGTASGSALQLILDEQTCAIERGEQPRGFAVYSRAGMDNAREGRPLVIGFGAFADTERDAREAGKWIGREIVIALRAEGLRVEWGGTAEDEILVVGVKFDASRR